MNARDVVEALIDELAITRDPQKITELLSPDYSEHFDWTPDSGRRESRLDDFTSGTRYQIGRMIAEDDMVVTHALVTSPDHTNLVGIDLWRVAQGKVQERWSSRAAEAPAKANGRSQLDGASVPDMRASSHVSKRIVAGWTSTVLIGADYSSAPLFLSQMSYQQHSPDVADGIDGFISAIGRQRAAGFRFDYRSIDVMIAEGDFVFTRGTGHQGLPVVFNDIWRIKDGKIVEHWDVVSVTGADSDELVSVLDSVPVG